MIGLSEALLSSSLLQQSQQQSQSFHNEMPSLETTARKKEAATTKHRMLADAEDSVSLEEPVQNSQHCIQNCYPTTSRRTMMVQSAMVCTTTALLVACHPQPSLAATGTTKQRCNADDPRCGPDGTILGGGGSALEVVKPIPKVTNRITHVVQLTISVGERREETGYIRFGLYGDDCPFSTRQMLEFLTPKGLSPGIVSNSVSKEDFIGIQSSSVSLLEGGIVPNICSKTFIEFGVPSQAKAYAQSRGLMKAGDNFLPQQRPSSFDVIVKEPMIRNHDVAGLISIPIKGIGYGDTTNGGDIDSAYSNAFLITASASDSLSPSFDKSRRVIGQIIDNSSMQFLERLSNLPLQKGSGVNAVVKIPGSGGQATKSPPLLKVIIRDIGVQKVVDNNNSNNKSTTKAKKG